MTTIVRAAAAAVLCLGLAACGGGGEEQNTGGSESQELEPPNPPNSANQSAPEVQNIPRPEQTMAAGRLSPVNNSGVTGSVNIRGLGGNQTEVSLNVTGITQGNQQLQGSIVQGTCEQSGGGEVASVGPIPVGAGNIAALTDTLQVPVGTVLNGQHALIIKGQNAGPATPPLACSPLPQWERLPPVG